MKTMAIRLEDDLHTQLSVLAQLEGITVTDAIRQAIGTFIETKRSQPELTRRAEAVLDEIERDATTRREAIASLFKESEPPTSPSENDEVAPDGRDAARGKSSQRPSRAKGGEPAMS
jgi:predicted transcriptional regulator